METQNLADIKKLLKDLSSINFKYEKLHEASDTQFNIFSILRKESEEVALHSRFIGELLDPTGTHNRGYLFQKLFLKQVIDNSEIDDSFSLEIERNVGKYGRIDLLLVGRENVLVIENKIYASDQEGQLQRYSNAAAKFFKSKTCHLFYLTLDGQSPTRYSLGGVNEDIVQCISYKNDIKLWLESCAKEVYESPTLRETIIQYLRLTKKLTGQTQDRAQNMEIQDLLLHGDNFKQALSIETVMTDAKITIQKSVWSELQSSLSSNGYEFLFVDYKFDKKDDGICNSFYKLKNRSYHFGLQNKILTIGSYTVHLYIEVEDRLYYGLTVVKDGIRGQFVDDFSDSEYSDCGNELAKLVDLGSKNDWWLGWKYSDDKINFRHFNEGNSAKLVDKEYRSNWVNDVSQDILKIIKEVEAIGTNYSN